MTETQLCILPVGEKYTPFKWIMRETKHGNALMLYRQGTLYLAMRAGKEFPADLTHVDHDRAAAFGVFFDGETGCPWPDFDAPIVPAATVETMTALLRRALPRAHVEVDGTRQGETVLTVKVEVPGHAPLSLTVSESLFQRHAGRLPSLCALIATMARQRRPTC